MLVEVLLALLVLKTQILATEVHAYTEQAKPFVALEYDGHLAVPAPTQFEPPHEWDKEAVLDIIKRTAEKYHVSEKEMTDTIACESKFQTNIQSYHVKNGVREDSWGVAQFFLPAKNKTADGRLITKEIALNPFEAIDALGYHFSIGNKSKWTCWNNIYGR